MSAGDRPKSPDAREIYEQLWQAARPAFERGEPQLDSHLPGKTNDPRRGVSLIFRPSALVQAGLKLFLDQLSATFPGQYFYRPEELHVTVVTIISGSEIWQSEMQNLELFRRILRETLQRHPPFELEFRGVTAAPNAVLFQGFPLDQTLEKIRADLRAGFAKNGFTNQLDRRYVSRTAHLTAMRFCQPGADWKQLAALLEANRQTPFGKMRTETLQLAGSDWYASAGSVRVFEEFQLLPGGGPTIDGSQDKE